MSLVPLLDLLVVETRQKIFDKLIGVASSLGLSTESWQPGDPTRSTLFAESGVLAALEQGIVDSLSGGFIRLARGKWKTLCAYYVYDVERVGERRAQPIVVLQNTTTTNYGSIEPGDIIVRNTSTGATYRNTSAGSLPGLGQVTLETEAEDEGSAGTTTLNAIDDLVTALPGVDVISSTVAVGVDEESDEALEARCLAKLGSLSPDGPVGAYVYVATTPSISGTGAVTRAKVVDANTDDGRLNVYLAGPAGAVSGGDVALVQDAFVLYAQPNGFRSTALSATSVPVSITATVYCYDTLGRPAADVKAELEALLASNIGSRPIGGDTGGAIYGSSLGAVLLNAVAPHGYDVSPIADVPLGPNEVATPSAITITVSFAPVVIS